MESLDFMVFRDGVEVGYHRLAFSGNGDRVDIDIDIDLEVGFGPITLYRYKHRNLEAWRGADFMAFESETDDDGENFRVRAMADNGNVQVEVSDDGDRRRFGVERQALLPSTYWSIDTVRCTRLLDTQAARVFDIAVRERGHERIRARGSEIAATRYDMTGDLEISLWYDDEARWVKTFFILGGAPFEYRLV